MHQAYLCTLDCSQQWTRVDAMVLQTEKECSDQQENRWLAINTGVEPVIDQILKFSTLLVQRYTPLRKRLLERGSLTC